MINNQIFLKNKLLDIYTNTSLSRALTSAPKSKYPFL